MKNKHKNWESGLINNHHNKNEVGGAKAPNETIRIRVEATWIQSQREEAIKLLKDKPTIFISHHYDEKIPGIKANKSSSFLLIEFLLKVIRWR